MNVQTLPLNILHISDMNVRKNGLMDMDEETESDLQSLAEDIKSHGLINPITVRLSSTSKNQYEIIAGQRRFLACKLANMTDIACNIIDADNDCAEIISLGENIQRLPMTTSEKCSVIHRMWNLCGRDMNKVHEKTHLSNAVLERYVRIAQNLSSDLSNRLDSKGSDKLSLEIASQVSTQFPKDDQTKIINSVLSCGNVQQQKQALSMIKKLGVDNMNDAITKSMADSLNIKFIEKIKLSPWIYDVDNTTPIKILPKYFDRIRNIIKN